MRLMWFQLKKIFRKAAVFYVLLAYAAILLYLYLTKKSVPVSLVDTLMKGMNIGFLPFGLGLFTISYMREDNYKDLIVMSGKKHSRYAMSKLSALLVFVVLVSAVYVVLLAAVGPLIGERAMVIGDYEKLLGLSVFYMLALMLFCNVIAFFTVLFKKVIRALYTLLLIMGALMFYHFPESISSYLVLPDLFHHMSMSSSVFLMDGVLAFLYGVIMALLYRLVNRK